MSNMANIKIKRELYEEIRAIIAEESWLGYNNVTSYCIDAIRKQINHHKAEIKKKREEHLEPYIEQIDYLKKENEELRKLILDLKNREDSKIELANELEKQSKKELGK